MRRRSSSPSTRSIPPSCMTSATTSSTTSWAAASTTTRPDLRAHPPGRGGAGRGPAGAAPAGVHAEGLRLLPARDGSRRFRGLGAPPARRSDEGGVLSAGGQVAPVRGWLHRRAGSAVARRSISRSCGCRPRRSRVGNRAWAWSTAPLPTPSASPTTRSTWAPALTAVQAVAAAGLTDPPQVVARNGGQRHRGGRVAGSRSGRARVRRREPARHVATSSTSSSPSSAIAAAPAAIRRRATRGWTTTDTRVSR